MNLSSSTTCWMKLNLTEMMLLSVNRITRFFLPVPVVNPGREREKEKREREREREREKQKERETDRHTDRETDGDRDRETKRETERDKERQRQREAKTERQRERRRRERKSYLFNFCGWKSSNLTTPKCRFIIKHGAVQQYKLENGPMISAPQKPQT